MGNTKQIKVEIRNFFKKNKEGILIGGIVGFLVGKFIMPNYIDFSLITTQGLIDVLKSGTTIEIVKSKIIWASTILGAGIGGIIDDYYPERWWK